jgi:dTDP-4-dehydrorhamnose reductase
MDDSTIFIVGANGQLGTALRAKYPNAKYADVHELDITNKASVDSFDWDGVEVIINAAAYTNVDGAETSDGRVAAWRVNAEAVGNLVHPVWRQDMTIVHISTDFVFDGTQDNHTEDEPFSPLSVYGDSKAAGDLLVSQVDKRYILRTSWVIGEGKNFVRTMLDLGKKLDKMSVIDDHTGRPTFTSELVKAIDYLLSTRAAYGTYNVSNSGEAVSWAGLTRKIFELAGISTTVHNTTNQEYYSSKPGAAPRPLKSGLALDKLHATGFSSTDWQDDLKAYIEKELSK